jgi:hypothetical protein
MVKRPLTVARGACLAVVASAARRASGSLVHLASPVVTCFASTGSMRASDDLSASALFGFESKRAEVFPDAVDPTNPVDLKSELKQGGCGNTVRNEEIELRVAYGGRGQITDVQQLRYGAPVLDIIPPY